MKKTLVNVIHPNLNNGSVVNKHWADELKHYPEKFEVRNLYEIYPDGKINVEEEQKIVESYEKIVFQFPMYWLSCPPLFKKWMDDVLSYGWAYGTDSNYKLKGKKIALALTTGTSETAYAETGEFKNPLNVFIAPFEISFKWLKADVKPFFVFFGAPLPFAIDEGISKRIKQSAKEYVTFVESL